MSYNFQQYQRDAAKTAIYPDVGNNFLYPTLGMVGEAGEVANKIKKIIRDKGGVINKDDADSLAKEIGDVLWYCATLCSELRLDMASVAKSNVIKLLDRQERDALQGSGDDR